MGDEVDPEAHGIADDTETPAQGYRHREAEASNLDGAATSGTNDTGDVGIWWSRSVEGGNETGADASADAGGSADGGSEGHAIPEFASTGRIDVGADAKPTMSARGRRRDAVEDFGFGAEAEVP